MCSTVSSGLQPICGFQPLSYYFPAMGPKVFGPTTWPLRPPLSPRQTRGGVSRPPQIRPQAKATVTEPGWAARALTWERAAWPPGQQESEVRVWELSVSARSTTFPEKAKPPRGWHGSETWGVVVSIFTSLMGGRLSHKKEM